MTKFVCLFVLIHYHGFASCCQADSGIDPRLTAMLWSSQIRTRYLRRRHRTWACCLRPEHYHTLASHMLRLSFCLCVCLASSRLPAPHNTQTHTNVHALVHTYVCDHARFFKSFSSLHARFPRCIEMGWGREAL